MDTNNEIDDDRALVVAYLHYRGTLHGVLKDDEMWSVYKLGDGYGKNLPEERLAKINEGWDWSHVRDSSAEAFHLMADWLRERGYGIDGPAAPKP